MKTTSLLNLFALLAFCGGQVQAQSPAPRLLPFQGRLTDQNGIAVTNGARLVQFKIYDAPSAGEAKWAGELHRTTVNGGLVNVLLGTKTTLNGVDFDRQLYLEITVDVSGPDGLPDGAITAADPPMLPRQVLVPVVFAKEAAEARNSTKLAGYDWSALLDTNDPVHGKLSGAKLADGSLPADTFADGTLPGTKIADASLPGTKLVGATVTAAQLSPMSILATAITDKAIQDRHVGILSQLTASDGVPTNAVAVDSTGNVGIGTTTPQAKLDVAGALQVAAMAQQSLGPNGFIRIGELIVQWGRESAFHDVANAGSLSTSTHTFPIPFPNEVFVVIPGMVSQDQYYAAAIAVQSYSTTTVTLLWNEWYGYAQNMKSTYIAIGR